MLMLRREALSGAGLAQLNDLRPVEAALAYASLGWPVMPLAWMSGDRCACKTGRHCEHPAKHPLIADGLKGASTDPSQLHQWWEHWPQAGIGVRTGAVSGLLVLDIDAAHGGWATASRLSAAGQEISRATLQANTGGGGCHLVYAHPGAPTRVPNLVGHLPGIDQPTPGIDLRGDGGYVVVAPSGHRCGSSYSWRLDPDPLSAPPAWLSKALAPLTAPAPQPLNGTRVWGYAAAALRSEAARVANAPEGVRNDRLNRSAFSLGTLVGAGALPRDQVEASLTQAAAAAGISTREAARTIASGLAAGVGRPRELRGTPAPRRHPAPRYSARRTTTATPARKGPRL